MLREGDAVEPELVRCSKQVEIASIELDGPPRLVARTGERVRHLSILKRPGHQGVVPDLHGHLPRRQASARRIQATRGVVMDQPNRNLKSLAGLAELGVISTSQSNLVKNKRRGRD